MSKLGETLFMLVITVLTTVGMIFLTVIPSEFEVIAEDNIQRGNYYFELNNVIYKIVVDSAGTNALHSFRHPFTKEKEHGR